MHLQAVNPNKHLPFVLVIGLFVTVMEVMGVHVYSSEGQGWGFRPWNEDGQGWMGAEPF